MSNTKDKKWHADILFDKRCKIGRVKFNAYMRRGNGLMGRLGGGWAWKLAILASKTSVVFELFVMTIRISWRKGDNK